MTNPKITPELAEELASIQNELGSLTCATSLGPKRSASPEVLAARKELQETKALIESIKLNIGKQEKEVRQSIERLGKHESSTIKKVVLVGKSKKLKEDLVSAEKTAVLLKAKLENAALMKRTAEKCLQEAEEPAVRCIELERRRKSLMLQADISEEKVLQAFEEESTIYRETKQDCARLQKAEHLLNRTLTLVKRAAAYMDQHVRLTINEGAASATNATSSVVALTSNNLSVNGAGSVTPLGGSMGDLKSSSDSTTRQRKLSQDLKDLVSVPSTTNRVAIFNSESSSKALKKAMILYSEATKEMAATNTVNASVTHPGRVLSLLDSGLESLSRSTAAREDRKERARAPLIVTHVANSASMDFERQTNSSFLPVPNVNTSHSLDKTDIVEKQVKKRGHRRAVSDIGMYTSQISSHLGFKQKTLEPVTGVSDSALSTLYPISALDCPHAKAKGKVSVETILPRTHAMESSGNFQRNSFSISSTSCSSKNSMAAVLEPTSTDEMNGASDGLTNISNKGSNHRRSHSATSNILPNSTSVMTKEPARRFGSISATVSATVMGDGVSSVRKLTPTIVEDLERVKACLVEVEENLAIIQPEYQQRKSNLYSDMAKSVIKMLNEHG